MTSTRVDPECENTTLDKADLFFPLPSFASFKYGAKNKTCIKFPSASVFRWRLMQISDMGQF